MGVHLVLVSIAAPMFVLAIALAYQRRVPDKIVLDGGRLRMAPARAATAPLLAGALLVLSLLLGGTAAMLWLLGGGR